MPAKSAVAAQADQCLAWYKPLLRDPANAYYTEPKFEDKRVLQMTQDLLEQAALHPAPVQG